MKINIKFKKNENIYRIMKGYRPKSDRIFYWIMYDLMHLFVLIKLMIFKRKKEKKEKKKKKVKGMKKWKVRVWCMTSSYNYTEIAPDKETAIANVRSIVMSDMKGWNFSAIADQEDIRLLI